MQHHHLCRNLPSPPPDHLQMEPNCARSLSRTDSFSSAITADDSSAPGPSTVWTDEKHSLYLKSLETSFVNQLHNSIALRGSLWKILWGPYSCRAMPTNNSGFAYQDGKRQNMDPQTNNLSLESTADSHIILENPCMEHLMSSGKRRIIECRGQEHNEVSSENLNGGEISPIYSARSSQQHSMEVSDQNFVDAGQEERSNCREKKRSKRVTTDGSRNNEVVPYENSSANYASTSRLVSSVVDQTDQPLRS